MKENTEKAITNYNKILKKFKLKEKERYKVNFEINELNGKSNVDEVEIEINVDKEESSPMILFDCYLDALFVGSFAFADKELIIDKYDRDAIKNVLDVPQNTRQYDISLLNKKFIDSLKIGG